MGLEEKLQKLRETSKELRNVKTADIISLFKKVGELWLEKKKEIVDRLTTGARYSKTMAELWVEPTAQIFFGVSDIYNILGKDGAEYLDGWHKNENGVLMHAEPLGVVPVVGVENAFPANLLYLINALATKNAILFKPAAGDDVTVEVLCELIAEANPNSPYARAIETEYWKGGEDIEKEKTLVRLSDAVLVSGHPNTVQHYKTLAAGFVPNGNGGIVFDGGGKPERIPVSSHFKLIIFPPKYGAQYMKLDGDLEKLAMGTALNVADWDQLACYAPLYLVVEGNGEEFVNRQLLNAMKKVEAEMPRAQLPESMRIDLENYLQETAAADFRTVPPRRAASNFRILYKKGMPEWIPSRHPNFRHLFVFEVSNLYDTMVQDPMLTKDTQTVSLYIPDEDERNIFIGSLATKGINRITPVYKEASGRVIGGVAYSSLGGPYDGSLRPFEFVNWVSDEGAED